MYEARAHGESYTNDVFIAGVNNFIETAVSKGFLASDNTIRCPCTKCKNRRFINLRMMEEHLYKYGFTPNYFNCTLHREDLADIQYVNTSPTLPESTTIYQVLDSKEESWSHEAFPEMIPNFASPVDITESSNLGEHQTENFEANRFFNLLNSSLEPAYEGCTTETEFSINMKMQSSVRIIRRRI
ncbi:unnamed protein product [Rhodiola kirilowii]